ncbi:MAG TPA: hypothetical protein VGG15_01235 [Terriglobales bacterium]
MATGDVPSLDLALKISDLTSASQLKSLLQGQAMPMFKFSAETAPYWNGPVEKMPQGTKLSFSLSQDGCWKTSTGISFGLTGAATCAIEILTSGCAIAYLENLDATSKAGLPADDYSGSVYVKLSLSFDITGNVSGAGSVGALGISGNAKGSAGGSFVFAHKIKCGTLLKDALAESFNNFVFPFQPSCALQMVPGDLAQVTFSGCMSYGLSLSYGIDTYNFSAPSVQTVLDSCAKGVGSLTLPSGTVDIGASATLGLTHSDDFTAIVQKLDANNAFLYLMRAAKTDVSGSAGINAQVSITTEPSISVDQQKLQAGVDHFTRGLGGKQAAALCGDLQGKLNDKLSDWMNQAVQAGAGLKAAWDAEKDTTLISKYKLALGNSTVLDHSWSYFCAGNIQSAVGAGGLILEPGSGVCTNLNRSLTVCVTFFNFFHAQDVSSYFQKTEAYVTGDGNIRFLFDIGEESDSTVNKALQKARIHFIAEAESKQPADVKLAIELSETNNRDEARHLAAIPGYLSQNPQSAAVAGEMQGFAAAHPKGTLNLNCVLESSAYGKLTCSPYNGNKPPADQADDAKNWQVFHDATVALLNLDYASGITYSVWQQWNEASTGAKVSDRRSCGDASAGTAFWEGRPPDMQLKLNYFCLASSDFMNLCDDLHQLAQLLSATKIPGDWNRLLNDLKGIVLRDVNTDFAKPAVASMLKLSSPKQVSYDKQQCGNALTYTINLS